MGIAAIGGYVYRGTAIAELAGTYVFGDFSTGFLQTNGTIFAADEALDGTWIMRELAVSGLPNSRIGQVIRAFGQDLDGEVYVLTSDSIGPVGTSGEVYRIVAAP